MSAPPPPAILMPTPLTHTVRLPAPGPGWRPAPAALPPPRRQRTKLWELNGSIHCSVIGTCLTTAELRRTMGKVLPGDVSGASDHDLHAQAVGLCGRHAAAAKLLQKALDARHEVAVKRFARLHGEAAAMEAWAAHRRAGDIPGAYWAVLTHPDVGHEGLRRAFGDVHMLSHLVGAANRADIRRLGALEDENAELRAKVERQQARLHEAVAARDAAVRQLGVQVARHASTAPGPAPGLPPTPGPEMPGPAMDDALGALRHLAADLQHRLDREAARRERLDHRLAEAQAALRAGDAASRAAATRCAAAEQELAALERHGTAAFHPTTSRPGAGQPAVPLPAQRVLYVGGRPGTVGQVRALLDAAGGTLLAHDGGQHDHSSLLPGLIGQADLVAFPVDCVSHDAALAVKRLCRQLGKPWAPLRTAGLGSFLAMLAPPGPPPGPPPATPP